MVFKNILKIFREHYEKRNEVSSEAHMRNTIEEMEKAIEIKVNLNNKLCDIYEEIFEKKYSEVRFLINFQKVSTFFLFFLDSEFVAFLSLNLLF